MSNEIGLLALLILLLNNRYFMSFLRARNTSYARAMHNAWFWSTIQIVWLNLMTHQSYQAGAQSTRILNAVFSHTNTEVQTQVIPLWRHRMETYSALLALCAGNLPVPDEFPTQRPATRGFDVSFDLRLNERLSKQSWGWWFETPLWRHCNVTRFWLSPPYVDCFI